MISDALDMLYDDIAQGNLVHKDMFRSKDLELFLDERDDSNFDDEWIRVFNKINELEMKNTIKSDLKNSIDRIREVSFKKAYEFTNNADLAGYVSDDMELIAKGILLEYQDKWLAAVYNLYKQKVFPHGKIQL
jgi:hypothetical protein